MAERAFAGNKTYRVMYKFWLDRTKPEENDIAETIHNLKKNRSFVGTIRDGIRLINDLRQGKTEVLKELFPWVLEEQQRSLSMVPQEQNLELFHQYFEQFTQKLTASPALPKSPPPRQIAPQEEFNFEITKAKSDENSALNLQLSAVGLGTIRLEELSTECLQYALQKNKLNAPRTKQATQILEQRGAAAQPDTTSQESSRGPKAMNVPQFTPPSFNDLDFGDL